MAEIFREGGTVVLVQTRDHPPPHVHVESSDYSIRVRIDSDTPSIMPLSKKARDTSCPAFNKLALELVSRRLADCKRDWEKYHGII